MISKGFPDDQDIVQWKMESYGIDELSMLSHGNTTFKIIKGDFDLERPSPIFGNVDALILNTAGSQDEFEDMEMFNLVGNTPFFSETPIIRLIGSRTMLNQQLEQDPGWTTSAMRPTIAYQCGFTGEHCCLNRESSADILRFIEDAVQKIPT